MLHLPKTFRRILSVRISMMVVSAMALLLMASLAVMLHYSRKTVKEETLEKALQTLECTIQRIDNILLSVEQTTGNTYFALMPYINQPDSLITYSRKVVETNPFVAGCAIAMRENFYKDHRYFMAYFHRNDNGSLDYSDSPVIQAEIFGNQPYTEQAWFIESMENKRVGWMKPLDEMLESAEPIETFCLPIYANSPYGDATTPLGVIGVDVSLNLLSRIVSSAKPSANSYCMLLDGDGNFIVHPDDRKLVHKTSLTDSDGQVDSSIREAAQAMMAGETGYRPFRMNGKDYYVFFKPFMRTAVPGRTAEKMNWSAGIVYPEDDIFGDYNSLLYYVLGIAIVGILLLFMLSRWIIRRQLMPLQTLSETAQCIAEGVGFRDARYEVRGTEVRGGQKDEIGRLQDNFMLMQRSLAKNIGELEELTETLRERGEGLRRAYVEAQKADRMKTAFLHNMTNQMIEPSNAINACVDELVAGTRRSNDGLADEIEANGHRIADLLENLIHMSDEEGSGKGNNGKEVGYV